MFHFSLSESLLKEEGWINVLFFNALCILKRLIVDIKCKKKNKRNENINYLCIL
ncbi:hypothetical protein M2101_000503 [Parabacteroides sp. PM5-20]|nr:hypothetical protein [Parabacteroides sp. PM5-20]